MANPGFGARHRGRIGGARRYQTVVMEYAPKADNMARKMEESEGNARRGTGTGKDVRYGCREGDPGFYKTWKS